MENKNWRDTDLYDAVGIAVIKGYREHLGKCELCDNNSLNFYMHRINDDTGRGAVWIWCSGCKSFSHFTATIPRWWNNCGDFTLENLTAVPIYLDSKLNLASEHLKEQLHIKNTYNR